MATMKKILAMLLALMMLGGCVFAEETAATSTEEAAESSAETEEISAEEEAESITELQESDVVCVLNGQNITWGDCLDVYNNLVDNYGSYYDLTSADDCNLFRAYALNETVTIELLKNKAAELGLDQLTEEEIAAIYAEADTNWDDAIASYISYFYSDLDSTDETAVADANAEAESYYGNLGYTLEIIRELYLENEILMRVQDYMVQDAAVTDEEIETYYQSLVDADKELYENDLQAYCDYNSYVDMMAYYASYYGSDVDYDYAWYRPEGYRAVKHILLPVDEELMTAWTDLAARLEEQNEEAAAEETDETEETEAATEEAEDLVTQEDVDAAYQAILDSKADIIAEIYQKIAEGVDFDELIATYGVDADGNASDPGMVSEPYKTSGYELCEYTTSYVDAFLKAAMSISEVGGVSDPYISDYGIHIVKYLSDIAAGPIELTEESRQALYDELLEEKQNELYSNQYTEWLASAIIEYTGLVPTVEEVDTQEDAE